MDGARGGKRTRAGVGDISAMGFRLLAIAVVLGVAASVLADTPKLPAKTPVKAPSRAETVRTLDLAVLDAQAKLRSADSKQRKPAIRLVRTSEAKLNASLDAWAKTGAAKTCTTDAQRTAALAKVASFAGIYFRRLAGSLHTDVKDLASATSCTGDITRDRMVADYFDAIAKDDLATATELVGKIEQQLQCMSAQQVKAASLALRWALEYTRNTHTVKGHACNAGALDTLDQAGLVILYRTFERSLPYGTIALDWMRTRRTVFLEGLQDPKSVLSRMRLFVGERASASTVVQLSAACRNDARGRLMTFVGADQKDTCDPLAALVRSFSDTRFGMGDCFALDLEPMPAAKGGAISQLGCRNSCSTLDALAKQKGSAPSPFTGTMATRMRADGMTPLGGRVSDVKAMCSSLGAGGVGAIGGTSSKGVVGCIIDAHSAAASGNFTSCISHGLMSAKPGGNISGASFRGCLTRQDSADKPPDTRPPAGSAEERQRILDKLNAAAEAQRAADAAREAPADATSSRRGPTDPTIIQQIGNGAREVIPIFGDAIGDALNRDLAEAAREHGDSTSRAERARTDPPPPPGTITIGPIPVFTREFMCGTEGSCASGCTGWDVFTQAFQTCAEQKASRFSKPPPGPVRVRPGPDSETAPSMSSPLMACVMPQSGGSLAEQMRGCLTINCPASQIPSVSSSDGKCRCNASVGGAPTLGTPTGNRSACSTMRCPMGSVPVATGARCVCQSSGGPTGPTLKPTSPITVPGAGSSAPAPVPPPPSR